MYGVIGSYVQYFYKEKWVKYEYPFLYLGISLLIITKILSVLHIQDLGLYLCVFSFLITSLGTLLLLPFLCTINKGDGIVYKFLTHINLISYSMKAHKLSF